MAERLEIPAQQWRRVSPRYILVDVVGALVFTVVVVGAFGAVAALSDTGWIWYLAAVAGVVMIIVIAFIPRRVRSIGYQLRDDDLLFRRGLLFQRFVSVPYGRMQLVDINRGPVSRALGLSDLRFVTAAASSGVSIPGLPLAEAEQLRDRLVELAESRRAGL
ncbi:PH domain-containing protein [Galbitalea soli]|uniref:PH domain-containing protein n=1 Tax=Galbitalea soli TaxID=1268042 RepID=A0A7C9TR80_9MICO|nr:PH domain-containing protein [Galbitalea soli]